MCGWLVWGLLPWDVCELLPVPVEPPSTGVRLKIYDRCRDLRSYITEDGTCTDRYGRVIGAQRPLQIELNLPQHTLTGTIYTHDHQRT